MTVSRRRLAPLRRVLDDAGVELVEVGHTGSGHLKLHCRHPQAGETIFIASHSPSDVRSSKNLGCFVRRWLRQR
jgi:hypothetical protein